MSPMALIVRELRPPISVLPKYVPGSKEDKDSRPGRNFKQNDFLKKVYCLPPRENYF